ncbi:hypothetical protein [Pseudomonas arsenicoxydans]|nr:hypothetical protein [Pseudomonas arsenicoxydans]
MDDEFEDMDAVFKDAVSVRSTRSWVLIPDDENPKRMLWHWVPWAEDDLDKLFRRVNDGNSSEEDHELFDACMLDRFIGRVEAGEPVEPWILASLAKSFTHVLMGAQWNDEIRLPGRPVPQIRSWREQRDLDIFFDVMHCVSGKGLVVTKAIETVAENHAVSYQAARAAYYRWKALSKNWPKP